MSTTPLTEAFGEMADEIYLASLGNPVIGVDAGDHVHRWHQGPDVIVAYSGRDVDHYQYVGNGSIDEYIKIVRDGRGWSEPRMATDRMVEADLSVRGLD